MGAEEHCKPYSHSLGKIPLRILPTQALQPQARTFNAGDHRNQGLKRSTAFQSHVPCRHCHKTVTVGDLQFSNMEKLSKIMSQ